ncbi:hypothetical protein [Methylophilus luteus]|uniref:Uncharacterized protein n=1 Tax=Methylophilus luteus TaxID=640108 RepID=A0ABW3F856_9PROT
MNGNVSQSTNEGNSNCAARKQGAAAIIQPAMFAFLNHGTDWKKQESFKQLARDSRHQVPSGLIQYPPVFTLPVLVSGGRVT